MLLKIAKGLSTNELTLLPTLFHVYANVSYWKIDFIVSSQSGTGGEISILTGMSSLILKTNSLPLNGKCTVSPSVGISLLTYFTISCSNWKDTDGQIVKYEFLGNETKFI